MRRTPPNYPGGDFRSKLERVEGVAAYDIHTPLFSDYAIKRRTVWMPGDRKARYRATGVFEFPPGTILTKTFSFPQKDGSERLIETRLLVRQRSGWIDLVYVWDRDQSDATLEPSPEPVPVKWVDQAGNEHATDYVIPNVNQCTVCHPNGEPLGPVARNVKLEQWTGTGFLEDVPAGGVGRPVVWDNPQTGSIEERARAYLDVNCSSCHRAGTRAKPLDLSNRREIVRRMESLDPEKGMPNLGRTVIHREGVALVRAWAELTD